MVKYLCDICSKETQREDLCILRIDKERIKTLTSESEFIPALTPLEICIFCKEKVVKFLSELKQNEETQN